MWAGMATSGTTGVDVDNIFAGSMLGYDTRPPAATVVAAVAAAVAASLPPAVLDAATRSASLPLSRSKGPPVATAGPAGSACPPDAMLRSSSGRSEGVVGALCVSATAAVLAVVVAIPEVSCRLSSCRSGLWALSRVFVSASSSEIALHSGAFRSLYLILVDLKSACFGIVSNRSDENLA